MTRPVHTVSHRNLCEFASAAFKGENPAWAQVSCAACTKKIWREKKTSTRRENRIDDKCLACSSKHRRRNSEGAKPFEPLQASNHIQPIFARPKEEVLDDLGVSLDTFRQLRNLQMREIDENDYELLMRLHAKPNRKVLEADQLDRCSECFEADDSFLASEKCAVCLCAMSSGEQLCRLACEGRHTFHSHCIGEWLRTASRCCPVDQQDLSALCLSA